MVVVLSAYTIFEPWFTFPVRFGDFLLLTYVNERLTNQSMGQISDCFCKGIEFTQSHRPEEANRDFYKKCETGLSSVQM